eukprot:gnl/TRDRNA2_/TRDRNA2_188140_c0_seq1.p1 gnl/TRDRNA2_/TRDRNA2_188140_c0~~gnl/TRDRNA2_/TRDRNA2_188140_c0_seq1.p1  ORF type:complete len:235 (-),score=48.45 gnl/TRDRNA2_/TRDRNA2_188140_c0_seq1:154-858(-)
MDWVVDRFLCCCVSPQGAHEEVCMNGEMLGTATTSEAGPLPLSSGMPKFPQASQRQEFPGPPMPQKDSSRGEEASARYGTMPSGRSASMGSSMDAGEKEREKARLQRLVKDFAKEAVTGIAVNLVNADTTRRSPHFFQMDRYLTVFSLKPKDGSTAESSVMDFNVRDLTAIYKGADVCVKVPSLGPAGTACVGLDTNRADRRLFFHFDDNYERDKFYTCLNILRMSVDITRGGG